MIRAFTLFVILNLAGGILMAASQAPDGVVLKGAWEGVIEDPKRPIVVATDFGSGTARMDIAGSSNLVIDNPSNKARQVRFQIKSDDLVFIFEGVLHENEIRGTVRLDKEVLPFWLEYRPVLPAPRDRVEAWQQDLNDVLTRFLRYDRSFSAEARSAFQNRIAALRRSLSSRSDQEIMVELARAVALGGNAHTRLYLIRNRTEVRPLPIRVWWFKDRLQIVRAAKEQKDLLGCQILKIGALDAAAATARVRGIKAGNNSWQRYMSAYFLTSPDILFGSGVIPSPEQLALTIKCDNETRVVNLDPLPLHRETTPVEAWWDLAPEPRDANASFLPALQLNGAPLYLRNTRKNYWLEYLPESRAIYIQYNRAQETTGGMTMKAFMDSLAREFDQRKPAALIFDLRFNTGGNLEVGTPLVNMVAEKLYGVPVYVITGRATFSAGITHVVQLKQWARATIVGER